MKYSGNQRKDMASSLHSSSSHSRVAVKLENTCMASVGVSA